MDKYNDWSKLLATQTAISGMANAMTRMSSIQHMATMVAAVNNPYPKTTLEYLTRGFLNKPINTIPSTAMNAILAIGQQYDRVSDMSRLISKNMAATTAITGIGQSRDIARYLFQNQRTATQLASLQVAIGGLSSQITQSYAQNKNWASLDYFAEIATGVDEYSEKVAEGEYISRQDFEDFRTFVQDSFNKIHDDIAKIGKDKATKILAWIAVISFILAIVAEARNWIPKHSEAQVNHAMVTKQEFDAFRVEVLKRVQAEAKEHNDSRIVSRRCQIRLKPKPRSIVIESVEKGTSIIVLRKIHKWCYISYITPDDSLTENGWVESKYLEREHLHAAK